MRFLQWSAMAAAAGLIICTVVPADERPYTGVQHGVEHFLAFFVFGGMLGAAFQVAAARLCFMAAAFTLALECVQIPLPTRHARLQDYFVDTAAVCIGILVVRSKRRMTVRQ